MICLPCQSTICEVDQDARTYSLQGLPPLPMEQSVPVALPFGNDVVYYDVVCGVGETLTYNGTLPGWITIDTGNNRLVGAAGTFRASNKDSANSTAQSAISDFAGPEVISGDLTCEP